MYHIIIDSHASNILQVCLNGSLRGICNKSCLILRNVLTFFCQINVLLLLCLTVECADFKVGVMSLATLLQIPTHPDHKQLLKVHWATLYIGIHWDILGYIGIHWDTLGYIGIHWDTLGYIGIHWDTLGYIGVHWDTLGTLGYIGIHWGTLAYIGVHWHTLGYIGIHWVHWDTLGYIGVHWGTLAYIGVHWHTLGYIAVGLMFFINTNGFML